MATGESSPRKRGWGPFSGGQLTLITCVAIVSIVVVIPTAALAATGAFTSATVTPAVTAINSSNAANAVGVAGRVAATGNAIRTGVVGSATGAAGTGVKGNGTKYGVYSNGPLGVAATKPLVCSRCVTAGDIANRMVVNFDLAPGANSAPVTIPADQPVSVVGVTTTSGYRGVGSVSMIRAAGLFLDWTGLEASNGSPSTITGNFDSTPGTHIVYIDYSHVVDLQVNDANRFRVHNGAGTQRKGVILITW